MPSPASEQVYYSSLNTHTEQTGGYVCNEIPLKIYAHSKHNGDVIAGEASPAAAVEGGGKINCHTYPELNDHTNGASNGDVTSFHDVTSFKGEHVMLVNGELKALTRVQEDVVLKQMEPINDIKTVSPTSSLSSADSETGATLNKNKTTPTNATPTNATSRSVAVMNGNKTEIETVVNQSANESFNVGGAKVEATPRPLVVVEREDDTKLEGGKIDNDVHTTVEAAVPGLVNVSPSLSNQSRGPNDIAVADSLWTVQCDGAVRLRMTEQGHASIRPVSVMTAFQDTVGRYPDQLAMAVKISGLWRSWTYRKYYADVWCAARALIRLGLEPYHGVGIIGFNSPEWFISNNAAIFAGGLSTGIYTTNSAESCRYVASHARCQVIVVENDNQLKKILSVRAELPDLKAIVQYTGDLKQAYPDVYTWSDFMRLGEGSSDTFDDVLQQRIAAQSVNKCCALIYTSGTTGNSKGVMLSHDNLTWTSKMSAMTIGIKTGCEVLISYLPLSHVAGQMLDIYIPLLHAASVYFAQPDAMKGTLVETMKEVEPTAFLGVPRVWEKMQEKLEATFSKKSWMKRSIFNWAHGLGLRGNLSRMNGRRLPFGWSIASAVVFSKIHAALGLSRCRICLTAAAPITRGTLEFFAGLDLPLMEIYGMSESSGPHTGNAPHHWRIASVGPAMFGMSVSIVGAATDEAEGGEICMDGRNVFMGYLSEEQKTMEAIDSEGLLHSGDIGKFDDDGFLYITGRIKELIITAGGENVAPVPIEDAVREALPCVSNCMVVGDRKKFLSILLTLKTNIDPETTEPLDTLTAPTVAWCKAQGSKATTVTEILERSTDPIMHAVQRGIDAANAKSISRAQLIQKFCILPRDFAICTGELGPTLKLKRPFVVAQYKTAIDNFYNDEE